MVGHRIRVSKRLFSRFRKNENEVRNMPLLELSDETLAAITSKDVSTAQQDAAAAPYAEVLSKFQEEIKALMEKKLRKDFSHFAINSAMCICGT